MNKFLAIGSLIIGGWILTDLLLHPNGVKQLGSTTNSLLTTTGNQVTGISTNNAKVLGG